jgi:transposase-like protein
MRGIYTAANEEAGLEALDGFEKEWGGKYSYAIRSWRANWPALSTFFRYPAEIRRLVYTTNPLEGFNRRIRKITKTKGAFPTEDSLFKLLYLIVIEASAKWTMPVHEWGTIISQLRIYFGDRVDGYL